MLVSMIVCITAFCFGVSPQECGRQAYDEISNVAIFEISVCIMPFSFNKMILFRWMSLKWKMIWKISFSLSSVYSSTISKVYTHERIKRNV